MVSWQKCTIRVVLKKAFPHFNIKSYLCLDNKNSVTTVEGLNQNFLLVRKDGRTNCVCKEGITKPDLGEEILINIRVDDVLENIYNGSDFQESSTMSFEEWVFYLARFGFNWMIKER